jgi:hypothetical protein
MPIEYLIFYMYVYSKGIGSYRRVQVSSKHEPEVVLKHSVLIVQKSVIRAANTVRKDASVI